jgi:hypothetical protein
MSRGTARTSARSRPDLVYEIQDTGDTLQDFYFSDRDTLIHGNACNTLHWLRHRTARRIARISACSWRGLPCFDHAFLLQPLNTSRELAQCPARYGNDHAHGLAEAVYLGWAVYEVIERYESCRRKLHGLAFF